MDQEQKIIENPSPTTIPPPPEQQVPPTPAFGRKKFLLIAAMALVADLLALVGIVMLKVGGAINVLVLLHAGAVILCFAVRRPKLAWSLLAGGVATVILYWIFLCFMILVVFRNLGPM